MPLSTTFQLNRDGQLEETEYPEKTTNKSAVHLLKYVSQV